MANWREHILAHFQPHIARLTLVADPDGLLTAGRNVVGHSGPWF